MARDYAPRDGRKGRNRRRSAPRWAWLLAGLTVGLFVAFLVFLSQQEPGVAAKPAAKQAKAGAATREKPAENGKPAAKTPEKKPMEYDFYTRLPAFEVEVPEEKGTLRTKPLASPGSYILQAGSFKSAKDADARKAELAMLGIVASVQTVTIEGNTEYHRVRIGPYRDLERLNRTRQMLRENHIEFVTLMERS